MLDKGVQGTLLCGEIPGAYRRERLLLMADSKPARTFQDLLVWQKAHGFVLEVYAFTATLPKQETYGLSLQMRRAAAILASDFLDSHIPKGYQGRSPWLGKA